MGYAGRNRESKGWVQINAYPYFGYSSSIANDYWGTAFSDHPALEGLMENP
jgi:hypothetical protein